MNCEKITRKQYKDFKTSIDTGNMIQICMNALRKMWVYFILGMFDRTNLNVSLMIFKQKDYILTDRTIVQKFFVEFFKRFYFKTWLKMSFL